MTINNPQNIEIFNSFTELFLVEINRLFTNKKGSINAFNENFTKYASSFKDVYPFQIWNNLLLINEELCVRINLNINEKHAMIAHEIGHYFDPNETDREYTADDLAVNLNLTDSLISGLHKIIDSEDYPDQNEEIQIRIDRLENMV